VFRVWVLGFRVGVLGFGFWVLWIKLKVRVKIMMIKGYG
jgi:hypothetical protein